MLHAHHEDYSKPDKVKWVLRHLHLHFRRQNPRHSPRRPTQAQEPIKKSHDKKERKGIRMDPETLKTILIEEAKRGGTLKPIKTTRQATLEMIGQAEKK